MKAVCFGLLLSALQRDVSILCEIELEEIQKRAQTILNGLERDLEIQTTLEASVPQEESQSRDCERMTSHWISAASIASGSVTFLALHGSPSLSNRNALITILRVLRNLLFLFNIRFTNFKSSAQIRFFRNLHGILNGACHFAKVISFSNNSMFVNLDYESE